MASLTPALKMTIGSLAVAALAVVAASGPGRDGLAAPVFGGLLGPLVAVVATWIAVERAFRRDPVTLMSVMVRAFVMKSVFFVAYVVVMIKVAGLSVEAFGISFVICFVALYAAEAVSFARLFRGAVKGAS
jgi:uncharacterized paraquat-inducible protein A